MFKLESRAAPSNAMALASPLIALAVTVAVGILLFVLLGKDPLLGLRMFFVEPIKSGYAWSEIAVKAVPLILIALGLALCFRSNVWNIGAEGQYILGAIFAGGIAMQATPDSPRAIVIVILVAGVVGGMGWAAITALLRDRFNANEILVSLMLVYVAEMVLSYLVYGPWKDPQGYNFPQTVTFAKATQVPRLFDGLRVNIGVIVALLAVVGMTIFLFRLFRGMQAQVGGLRRWPRATAASVRAPPSGPPCSPRAGWPAWPARSRPPGRWGSSRPMYPWATASPPSSWRSWGACTRWASSSRPC